MKVYITILCLFLCNFLFARNYYISSSGGNDGNNGTATGTAWASINKVNASMALFAAGDSILFKRGDTFFGNLVMTKSGSNGNPVVIGAYSSGAKPLFSGLITLSTWSSSGMPSGVQKASFPNGKNNLNLVVLDGLPVAVGRYPNANAVNAGFLTLESYSGVTSITDNQLPASPSWVGSEMILQAKNWWTERTMVTAQSGTGTVTYRAAVPNFNPSAGTSPNLQTPDVGRGFFFQRNPITLDIYKEWYFDTTAGSKNLQFFWGANNPASHTVKVSVLDTLLSLGNRSFITVRDINFEGANAMGICAKDGGNNNFISCDFNLMGSRAILIWAEPNILIDSCRFENVLSSSIDDDSHNSTSTNHTVRNNIIHNNAVFVGMNEFWSDDDGKAIVTNVFSNQTVNNNSIINVGFVGIQFGGNNVLIQKNFVDTFNFVKDDGGGIYTYHDPGATGVTYTNRVVQNNIVLHGIGVPFGATDCEAFYLDGISENVTIQNNTAAYTANHGVYTNNPLTVTIRGNTLFNNLYGVGWARYYYNSTYNTINNKSNITFSTTKTGGALEYVNTGINTPTTRPIRDWIVSGIGQIDSNYYHFRFNAPFHYWYFLASGSTGLFFNTSPLLSFPGWRQYSFNTKDPNTTLIPTIPYYSLTNTIGANGITNGTYNSNITGTTWAGTNTNGTLDGTSKLTGTNSFKLAFTSIGASLNYSTVFINSTLTVSNTNNYLLKFSTKADSAYGNARVWLRLSTNPFTVLTDTQYVYWGQSRSDFQLLFSNPISGANVQAVINIEQGGGNTYLDDIELYQANASLTNYTDTVMFRYNNSNTIMLIDLGSYQWTGVDGNNYTGNYKLMPWTSVILRKGVFIPGNIPPVANAGPDRSVTLPTNTLNMAGSGSDQDGSISAYLWTKVSGPSGGAITNPANPTTAITGLIEGTYTYNLRVTDNSGDTATDLMQIVVNAAVQNSPPTANAGADQAIILPTSSTTLTGSGTDPEGGILTYSWVKLSGPTGGAITSPNSALTGITGLVQGVYTYQLTVTDNGSPTKSGVDALQIVVNAAPIAPTANAGSNQTITLPTNSTTLVGSGTDPDGTIVGYGWVKFSGPSGGTITSPSSATTGITGLIQGNYTYQLTVTDDDGLTGTAIVQITVNDAPNVDPIANAGTNQSITLPTNFATLNGTGSTDPDGTIISYLWTHISGPTGSSVTSPNSATTGVTGLTQGVHTYSLMVTDDRGGMNSANVSITVNPAIPPVNQPPVANAGADQSIQLPVSSVTLNGTGSTDPDGFIVSYRWTKVTGGVATIASPNSATTNVTGLAAGVYNFSLKVVDNNGDSSLDVMQVTVLQAANIPPTADAGGNRTITLPQTSIALVGSGTDQDGSITAYQWTQTTGPNTATISNPTSASTTMSNLIQGTYIFRIRVTDNRGDTATNSMQLTVNPANLKPVANAGADQVLTLPQASTVLQGSGTDEDGTVTAFFWVQLSGPNAAAIANNTLDTTGVTNLIQGTYTFRLRVTDNTGDTAVDIMQITVNAPIPNVPPVASAGGNQTVNLPIDFTTLFGSGTDQDGTVVGYSWIKITGPSGGNITSPTSATTGITGLLEGIYQYQLTVYDNDGDSGTSVTQILVNPAPPANIPPVANAGSDSTITLPRSIVTLLGSGTDEDGTIVSYSWTKLTGPTTFIINTPNSATTVISNLGVGTYVFQLTVTDNSGDSDTANVTVTVNPEPPPPATQLELKGYDIQAGP